MSFSGWFGRVSASARSRKRRAKEARIIGPFFDSGWYLERNADVRHAGVNALEHFLEFGWREGRWPNQQFDPSWYLAVYPDIVAAGCNPFVHYVEHGIKEGRDPSEAARISKISPHQRLEATSSERAPSLGASTRASTKSRLLRAFRDRLE